MPRSIWPNWIKQLTARPSETLPEHLDRLLDELCLHCFVFKTAEIESLLKQLDEDTVHRLLIKKDQWVLPLLRVFP